MFGYWLPCPENRNATLAGTSERVTSDIARPILRFPFSWESVEEGALDGAELTALAVEGAATSLADGMEEGVDSGNKAI